MERILDACVTARTLRVGEADKYCGLFFRRMTPGERKTDLRAMRAHAADGELQEAANMVRAALAQRRDPLPAASS